MSIHLPASTIFPTATLVGDLNSDGSYPQTTVVETSPGVFAPISAALEIKSNLGALLPPRMGTASRDALPAVGPGLVIYNIDSNTLQLYNSIEWLDLGAGAGISSLTAITGTTGRGITLSPTNPLSGPGTIGLVTSIRDDADGMSIGNTALIPTGTTYQNFNWGLNNLNDTFTGDGANITIGGTILPNITTGSFNLCIGGGIMFGGTTASQNTAIGLGSLSNNIVGNGNTALGFGVFNALQGSGNTGVGSGSGGGQPNMTNCSFLGSNSSATVDGLTNAAAIGSGAQVSASNAISLGNQCNVGIGNPAPSYPLQISNVNNVSALALGASTNTPSTPGNGGVLYAQSINLFYKDSAGTVTNLLAGGGGGAPSNATYFTKDDETGSLPNSRFSDLGNNNFRLGLNSLASGSLTGLSNHAFGIDVLTLNASGQFNSGFGYRALSSNVSGIGSSAFGSQALENSTAQGNSGFGARCLNATTIGEDNSCLGVICMESNVSGKRNSIVGTAAMGGATAADECSGLGWHALASNTTNKNVAVGCRAADSFEYTNSVFLGADTDAASNGLTNVVAIGDSAIVGASNSMRLGNNLKVGINNATPAYPLHVSAVSNVSAIAMDNSILVPGTPASGGVLYPQGINLFYKDNTGTITNLLAGGGGGAPSTGTFFTKDDETGTMPNSIFSDLGPGNFRLGINSLTSGSLTGFGNHAFGKDVLTINSGGQFNTGCGYQALSANTIASSSSAFGHKALKSSIGGQNSAFGTNAGINTTSGTYNSSFGAYAHELNTTGQQNSCFGEHALSSSTNANDNSAFGFQALRSVNDHKNVGIGCFAGSSWPNYNSCIFIGYGSDTSANSLVNAVAIGESAIVDTSDSMRLGQNLNVGINHGSPTEGLHLGAAGGAFTPRIYITSSSTPVTPSANDAILWTGTGKMVVTSGTNKYTGTVVTAHTADSSATAGTVSLNGATGTLVSTTSVNASSIVLVTHSTGNTAPNLANVGELVVGSIVNNNSFVIYSSNVADTADANWLVINP